MTGRDFKIFASALLISIFVAFLSRWILTNSTHKNNLSKSDLTVPVLVANTDIPARTKITRQMVEWHDWPKNAIAKDFITNEKPQLYEQVTKGAARVLITRDEPIRLNSLFQPGTQEMLADLITPGNRAFTINLSQGTNIPSLIVPGDYVDIGIARKSSDNKLGYVGETVVHHVKVIAVDADIDDDIPSTPSSTPPKTITIEVTPHEADSLTAALKDNIATISLYGSSDKSPKIVDNTPQPSSALPTPPKAASETTIKIIRGNSVTSTNVKNAESQ